MDIPTEADWRSEPWGIDTPCAYENFYGKSIDEAVRMFEEDAIGYQEDVMFMPTRVFGYYFKAYMAYLMSPAAEGDADGASCFVSLIEYKAQYARDEIEPLWSEIERVLKRLADHQDFFDAEWVIYGSFRARIREIVDRGFRVGFDTLAPDVVPQNVGLTEMIVANRTIPMEVAAQVFANSGISEMASVTNKSDLFAVLGPPDQSGGGEHPTIGVIAEWARYNRSECSIRFEFLDEAITSVMFLRPGD